MWLWVSDLKKSHVSNRFQADLLFCVLLTVCSCVHVCALGWLPFSPLLCCASSEATIKDNSSRHGGRRVSWFKEVRPGGWRGGGRLMESVFVFGCMRLVSHNDSWLESKWLYKRLRLSCDGHILWLLSQVRGLATCSSTNDSGLVTEASEGHAVWGWKVRQTHPARVLWKVLPLLAITWMYKCNPRVVQGVKSVYTLTYWQRWRRCFLKKPSRASVSHLPSLHLTLEHIPDAFKHEVDKEVYRARNEQVVACLTEAYNLTTDKTFKKF